MVRPIQLGTCINSNILITRRGIAVRWLHFAVITADALKRIDKQRGLDRNKFELLCIRKIRFWIKTMQGCTVG